MSDISLLIQKNVFFNTFLYCNLNLTKIVDSVSPGSLIHSAYHQQTYIIVEETH